MNTGTRLEYYPKETSLISLLFVANRLIEFDADWQCVTIPDDSFSPRMRPEQKQAAEEIKISTARAARFVQHLIAMQPPNWRLPALRRK